MSQEADPSQYELQKRPQHGLNSWFLRNLEAKDHLSLTYEKL
jgi:hypothetical protein